MTLFTQVQFGPLTAAADRRDDRGPGAGIFAGLGLGHRQLPRHAGRAAGRRGVAAAGHRLAGLPLYAAAWSGTGTGQVTDLEYSDGLSVISLFVQRGTLAASMAGWQPLSLHGTGSTSAVTRSPGPGGARSTP